MAIGIEGLHTVQRPQRASTGLCKVHIGQGHEFEEEELTGIHGVLSHP
jgi:hypothetical protein